MRKTLLLAFLVIVLALLLAPGTALAIDPPPLTAQIDEIAWKTGTGDGWARLVGDVYSWRDGDTLSVLVVAYQGFKLAETHVAIGATTLDIPHTPGGPVPGRFPYGAEHNPYVQYQLYQIPVAGLTEPFVVLAHAVVVNVSSDRFPLGMTETGWGTGCTESHWAFPGSNWARYFEYSGRAGR